MIYTSHIVFVCGDWTFGRIKLAFDDGIKVIVVGGIRYSTTMVDGGSP